MKSRLSVCKLGKQLAAVISCSEYKYILCLLHWDFNQVAHGRLSIRQDLTKQHAAQSITTQFRKKGAETLNILLVVSEKMYKFSSSPRRADRISSSLHYSFCFTSGHFQASTGPGASLVPVQHHLGASSEACLVLRRLDEICMDTEGKWGGGRRTRVPFILVGFPWSLQFCGSWQWTVLIYGNEPQNWGFFQPVHEH